MSAVLCAIRGGPESQVTLERAVELAKQHTLPLHLLYVVNLDFLRQVTGGHIQAADDELVQMGNFILEMARQEAEAQGAQVMTHIKRGRVTPQLIALANELNADYIVLGQRRPSRERPAPVRSVVLDFVANLRTETSAEVVVVEAES